MTKALRPSWKTAIPSLAPLWLLSACCGCPGATFASTPADVQPLGATSTEGATAAQPYHWRNVKILGGGFVTGVIFSPVEKDLVYARTDIGGAYRWNPADGSWTPITDFLAPEQSNYLGIESLAADPLDPNRVYMAVGTYTQSWAGNGAFLRSGDRGKTWEVTYLPIKMGGNENGRGMGERLAVDPNKNDTVLFGSRKYGLWRSDDAGAHWAESTFPHKEEELGVGISFVLFDKSSGKPGAPTPVVYAGWANKDEALYVSKNNGKDWEAVAGQPKGMLASHAGFDSEGTLYLSYGDTPGPGDMKKGAIWKYVPKTKQWSDITPLRMKADDQFGYGGLSVLPSAPGTLLVTTIDRWGPGDEVFRSTNGGKNWQAVGKAALRDDAGAKYLYWGRTTPEGVSHSGWMNDIDIDPFNPNRALYVTGQGIWGSDDLGEADSGKPAHFSFRNLGLEETAVMDLASPPSGPLLFSGLGDICGFRHDDLDVAPPLGMFTNPIFGNGSSLDYAESKPDLVVRVGSRSHGSTATAGALSIDAGKTWTPFATDPAGNGSGSVVLSADGATILWAPKDAAVVSSTDQGKTWLPAQGLPAAPKLPDWAPVNFRIASDRVNPKKFYVYDAMSGAAYASSDGGLNFTESKSGLPKKPDWGLAPTSIEAVPGHEGHAWASTGDELYRSTDSGTTFQALDGVTGSAGVGFGKGKDGSTYPAVFLIGKVNEIYGIYRSDDEGKSWVRINDATQQFGGPNRIVGDPRTFGRAYIGTHGRGILVGEPQ